MKILITGSRGFMGGSVGRYAARAGHEVLGIGRSSQPVADWPGRYIQADVVQADLSGIIAEFAPDALVHAAGSASVGGSMSAPLDDLRASVLAWANTVDGVRRSGRKPLVVFPSSAAVYGNPVRLPVPEEAPIASISPYGYHKAACELLAREYAACFGLNILVCRFFSVFGETQRRLLIWDLYTQFAAPDPVVWLQGTGQEARDYLYVEDAATAVLALAADRSRVCRSGECVVVNIASGEEISVRDVAGQIRALVAPEKEIRCRGLARPGDPRRWCADISRLRSLAASWRPRSFPLTLKACIAAWQARSETSSCGV